MGGVGSLVVRASDSRYKRSTCSLNQWVRKSCGLNHECRGLENIPSPSVPCQNCGGGDRWCRQLSSLWGNSPSQFVLSPVWCSRPTTGILLAPCYDEFRGPRSDYVRQVASATITTLLTDYLFKSHFKVTVRLLATDVAI
ncbi:uncharacterized protein TNCV_2071441 [Trichonephila clavipes]|uniref:Uncharacterized protein n=1 Tax=Trichonephila clavipes TaxID=2585209 RepID=A0A8X6W3W4_TRICX|nr:uncharacterized protein TNCV_2071441 [Trichonephila clavipes]